MSITLKTPDGTSGECAVRIINGKIVPEKVERDIRTRLLMESELRGRIENPAYYFSDDPEAEQNLDLVMMVNGWSRYNLPEAIKGKYEEPLIPLEIGQEISGQFRSRWKGKTDEGGIHLCYSSEEELRYIRRDRRTRKLLPERL